MEQAPCCACDAGVPDLGVSSTLGTPSHLEHSSRRQEQFRGIAFVSTCCEGGDTRRLLVVQEPKHTIRCCSLRIHTALKLVSTNVASGYED
jgi:hypothetical protein